MENIDDVKQPCPFCGGYDLLMVNSEEGFNKQMNMDDERIATIGIKCIRCHARLGYVSHGESYQVAREHLMERWNKRWRE